MADNLYGVTALYRLIDFIVNELNSNPFCNTVTQGTLTEVDLSKMTIFPMANIVMDSVTHNDNTLTFQITITNVDIVEISKELPVDKIYGNDNLIYIWTNQLYVINRLISRLKGSDYFEELELIGDPQSDFINKEFENMLAGFQTTLTISLNNNIDKC
jgi:hypothetical protein